METEIDLTTWVVEPTGPLRGDVTVSGSKNAVTKHMVAALLGDTPSEIAHAPRIGDVDITAGMLRSLGAKVEVEADRILIDPKPVESSLVPSQFGRLNRIPILLLGPLLHRCGEAFVPVVGGDRIGARPLDFHFRALEAMGAELRVTDDGVEAKASRLEGARIRLPYPSVGATETVLLTGVLAEGRTIIENAAIEPEVMELAFFLQRMGARIELRPERLFVVEGVPSLHGASHRLSGDRIEGISYLVAGLASGGRVRIIGCDQAGLATAITTLHRLGARFEITDESIVAEADLLGSGAVATDTHPGYMTDWQPPLVVLFTQCQGLSVVHETVFQERFGYVDALRAMGAEIELFDQCLGGPVCRSYQTNDLHSAVIRGPTRLMGADVEIPDLRAGFAHVLAAAVAHSPSKLLGVHHLERGYEQPLEKFAQIGLSVKKV
jgi:UDP-N-acetylglucosamine 1-carboxyvinyltransferase